MTLSKSRRSLGAAAIMSLACFTAMCGERDGAKIKIHPSSPNDKGAAGDGSDSLGAAGENAAGSGGSGGSGGTSNGSVGGSNGGPMAGEGGNGSPDGSGGTSATSGTGATGGTSDTGGTSATGGSAADASGGTDNQTGGTGGTDASVGGVSGTSGGANGGRSSGVSGRGGTSGAASGGAGVSGLGGAGGCGTKTGCCAPDDPPCSEGCPPVGEEFCCNPGLGARITCDAGTEFADVVCLNSCTGESFGTGSCDACLGATDPLCSNPTWDDACLTGGDAYCSDPVAGYRAFCNGTGSGTYYSGVFCTCSPGPDCVPTPCCGASSPTCGSAGCDPAEGYCCSETQHYQEVCTDLGSSTGSQQFLCLNDCTGRSYGTGSCVDCVVPSDPPCDVTANWMTACNQTAPVYCSDPDAGYRMRCLELLRDDGSQYPNIEIACACNAGP